METGKNGGLKLLGTNSRRGIEQFKSRCSSIFPLFLAK